MYLEIIDLNWVFVGKWGLVVVLKNINMYIEIGEFVCVVGVFGFGKLIFLRLIVGLDILIFGIINVDG